MHTQSQEKDTNKQTSSMTSPLHWPQAFLRGVELWFEHQVWLQTCDLACSSHCWPPMSIHKIAATTAASATTATITIPFQQLSSSAVRTSLHSSELLSELPQESGSRSGSSSGRSRCRCRCRWRRVVVSWWSWSWSWLWWPCGRGLVVVVVVVEAVAVAVLLEQ